jgi:hypothetical protein
MKSLKSVIRTLRAQRRAAASFVEKFSREIERIDAGLLALGGKVGRAAGRKRRKMSAAARRKIAMAQKARWQKVRARAKSKGKTKTGPKVVAAA